MRLLHHSGCTDLFSLRALSTVGRALAKWIKDFETIRGLATAEERARLQKGYPAYLGYITSAFKVNAGRNAANPHADWEKRIAPRVRDRIVKELQAVSEDLVPEGGNKIGGVKHFHSLAPEAQRLGIGIAALKGHVNPGHNAQIKEAKATFDAIAKEILARAEVP